MIVRITYAIVPPGHNGPVTRVSCGAGNADAYLRRYAQLAARQFLAATHRPRTGADGYEVVRLFPGPRDTVLATVEVEAAGVAV